MFFVLSSSATGDPREPNLQYVGWHSLRTGPPLQWWVEKLNDPRLVPHLLHGS